jgi:protein involved in polysaccharide export with SLBB domain
MTRQAAILLCIASLCVGCRTPTPDGTLQNGDRLRVLIVTMIGKSDTRVCIVDESGHIRLPMIGNIPVAGSTPAEIDAAALKLYQDAALHIESVSTTLEDRRETHNEMPGHVP